MPRGWRGGGPRKFGPGFWAWRLGAGHLGGDTFPIRQEAVLGRTKFPNAAKWVSPCFSETAPRFRGRQPSDGGGCFPETRQTPDPGPTNPPILAALRRRARPTLRSESPNGAPNLAFGVGAPLYAPIFGGLLGIRPDPHHRPARRRITYYPFGRAGDSCSLEGALLSKKGVAVDRLYFHVYGVR